MELDLAQVAAGLPMALSLAVAGGISTLREGRRRSALNEAMHELRRPLQALSLALPADPKRAGSLEASLRMAVAALERLDCEINGVVTAERREPLKIEPFIQTAAAGWKTWAAALGRSLELRVDAPFAVVRGDGVQLAQAVDNMINNGFVHGSGEVALEVRRIEERVRISVVDEGPGVDSERPGASLRARLGGRRRHGHGLRVVGRVARAHDGTFRLLCTPAGTEARLELPLERVGAEA